LRIPTLKFIKNTPFTLREVKKIKSWLSESCVNEGFQIETLYYNFISDPALLKINKQFLDHNTLTDIITFDYTEGTLISGEIYISIDRLKENAKSFKTTFQNEFLRITIHGLLHLCGYKDKSKKDKLEMTAKEDYYMNMFHVKH